MPLTDRPEQQKSVGRLLILQRGLRGSCPNCGNKTLFRGWFQVFYRCPSCGLKIQRSDGFFLGAMVWNYALTVFLGMPLILLAGWYGFITVGHVILLCTVVAVVGPLVGYRFAWSLWLMAYYWVLPHELPANANAHISVDEDE